jgi:hypothetical protein
MKTIRLTVIAALSVFGESQRPRPSQTFEFALTKRTRHGSWDNQRSIFDKIEMRKE